MIKNIENLLKLNTYGNYMLYRHDNRKIYENKNIIDRFVLEAINHGITPYINNNINNNTNFSYDINYFVSANKVNGDINIDDMKEYIFFNKDLTKLDKMQNSVYYKKMLDEYNEKKIKITPDKKNKFDNIIIDANKKFTICINSIRANKNNVFLFRDIMCNIGLTAPENLLIRYRDYIKIINFSRYSKIIKNYDKPFPFDILRMILRYSIFDISNQQWSIGINLYDNIISI